jgi:hypothetical protein
MEDLPTSLLTQQEKAKSRSGEELETFGKHAASIYLKGECGTLSEAVVETVKSAGLGPEQVRRVVEFTNTSAYLQKFASEGPNHKVVNFKGGPASFPDIIRDLNDGGGGSVFDKAASLTCTDYLLPPPDVSLLVERGLSRLGVFGEKLAEAFHTTEVPIPYEEPLRDAADLKDKLAGLRDEATHELSGLETRYLDLCGLLFGQVKQAALEGTPLGHLVSVMSTVTQEPEFFKAAFAMLTPRLVDNEVFPNEVAVASSLEKYAGAGLVNPAHPLVGIFEDYCDTLQKLAATRTVREEAVEALGTLSTYLSKAASVAGEAGSVLGEAMGYVPKGWRAAKGLAARASKPVGEFASALGGEDAGNVARWATEHVPHAAALIAGEEVYQRAKNNPALQATSNFALARVPYTHQNMMRQYALQQGLNY